MTGALLELTDVSMHLEQSLLVCDRSLNCFKPGEGGTLAGFGWIICVVKASKFGPHFKRVLHSKFSEYF